MLFGHSAAAAPTTARNTGSKSPLERPSNYRRARSRAGVWERRS